MHQSHPILKNKNNLLKELNIFLISNFFFFFFCTESKMGLR
jgi:hypothetical protein